MQLKNIWQMTSQAASLRPKPHKPAYPPPLVSVDKTLEEQNLANSFRTAMFQELFTSMNSNSQLKGR